MNKSNNMSLQYMLGLFYIIMGIVIIIVAAGELLLRLAIAFVGLYVINSGLQMRGKGSLMSGATRLFFGGFRFR